MHREMINDNSTQANSYYDPYFVTTEDEGTTHVSVLDKDGNAVSATDTINYALDIFSLRHYFALNRV